jgi:hypothetical protein
MQQRSSIQKVDLWISELRGCKQKKCSYTYHYLQKDAPDVLYAYEEEKEEPFKDVEDLPEEATPEDKQSLKPKPTENQKDSFSINTTEQVESLTILTSETAQDDPKTIKPRPSDERKNSFSVDTTEKVETLETLKPDTTKEKKKTLKPQPSEERKNSFSVDTTEKLDSLEILKPDTAQDKSKTIKPQPSEGRRESVTVLITDQDESLETLTQAPEAADRIKPQPVENRRDSVNISIIDGIEALKNLTLEPEEKTKGTASIMAPNEVSQNSVNISTEQITSTPISATAKDKPTIDIRAKSPTKVGEDVLVETPDNLEAQPIPSSEKPTSVWSITTTKQRSTQLIIILLF